MHHRLTVVLLLLSVSSCAQQQHSSEAKPSPYDYKIALDASQPVAGHDVLDIDALDFDDNGDFAILAFCRDGVGIWSSKAYGWVVFSGSPVTTAEGHQATVRNVGPPSIGPDGSVRYAVDYQDGTQRLGLVWKLGYFRDHALIYERDGYDADTATRFTPDNKILFLGQVKGHMSLWEGGGGNQPPVDKLPSNVQLGSATALTVDRTTGMYAFFGSVTLGGQQRYALVTAEHYSDLNNVRDLGVWRVPLRINAKGDVAFTVGDHTILDMKPSHYPGMLLALNDNGELLLRNDETVSGSPQHDSLNNLTVLVKGSLGHPGQHYLGLPAITNHGFLADFKDETLNNKHAVAAVVKFIPVGKYESATTINARTIPTIDGQPNPWMVLIATPKK
jgi:hypothetical protein